MPVIIIDILAITLSFGGIIFALQSNFNNYDGIYCYLVDKTWSGNTIRITKKYDNIISKYLGSKILTIKSAIIIIFLSIAITFLVMFISRGMKAGFLYTILNDITGSKLGIPFIAWSFSSAIVSIPSIAITRHFIKKVISSNSNLEHFKFACFDLISVYFLVSISMYLAQLTTLPLFTWYRVGEGIELFHIIASYAHVTALKWPMSSGLIKLDGLPVLVITALTILPTLIFIILIFISSTFVLVLKIVSPVIAKYLNWLSEKQIANVSWFTTIFAIVTFLTLLKSFF